MYYLVSWGDDKERAWSGTDWSLFCALSKRMDVKDVDITVRHSFCDRILNKLKIRRYTNDLDMANIRTQSRKAKEVIRQEGRRKAVFQFAEVVPETEEMPSYLYIDVNAAYIGYMKENAPNDFDSTGYGKCGMKNINKRGNQQNRYIESCSGVFTMGAWIAKDLVERCGMPKDKIHHVGGGINLDSSKIDDSHKKRNKFLFVGRDFNRKNGPLVYSAFKLLQAKHPDWELHVAGPASNPYPDDASGKFCYHGDCGKEKLSELFNNCDLFVMPSRFEAYGLAFIEALTYGLPCIGRNAYEMPYFIEDGVTGRILEEQTPESLAALMEEVMEKEKYFQEVKKRRNFYLSEYSWDKVADRIVNIINSKG